MQHIQFDVIYFLYSIKDGASTDSFIFAIWPKAVRDVVHFQECGGTFQGEAG